MQTYPLLVPVERPHLAILHIPQKVCQSKALKFMNCHALTSPLVNSKHADILGYVVITKILFTDLNYLQPDYLDSKTCTKNFVAPIGLCASLPLDFMEVWEVPAEPYYRMHCATFCLT